jgi:hypothetical protein
MDSLKVEIRGIKSISHANFDLPLESGVYCFVGNNGCGKSTLLLALSQIYSRVNLDTLRVEDYAENSFVKFEYDGKVDNWVNVNKKWSTGTQSRKIKFNGMYEGSLFYGTRFNDSRIVDNLLEKNEIAAHEIVESDDYIKEKLSYILHGDNKHYTSLKRIKNREIARRFDLTNVPYFYSVGGKLISQYRMSSGECLLISLLHFVYNSLIRKSMPINQKVIVFIDEIELALHPIAVSRFLDLLKDLHNEHGNLVIFLTSHAPDVIRKIDPKNMYMLKNNSGNIELINPCFPSYAIRDVYKHDGFDHLLLVEDILAAHVINKVLLKNQLKDSKLVHVVPVGGWRNVLQLHKDLLQNNVLGLGREISSILDGDIIGDIGVEHKSLRKLFLPIKSVEKYIYKIVFEDVGSMMRKNLNDKYFPIKSIDEMVAEHHTKYKTVPDSPDKKFYFRLKKDLIERGISEEAFIQSFCDDIMQHVDFEKFEFSLTKLLSKSGAL